MTPRGYRSRVITPAPPSFDARPLTDPVDPKAVKAFFRDLRSGRSRSRTSATVVTVLAIGIFAVVFTLLAGVFLATGLSRRAALPFVLFIVVFAIAGVWIFFGARRGRVARYRLSRFATANGMTYEDRIDDPALPGMIFGLGRARHSLRVVRGHSPRFVEFGNYEYTTKSGKNSTTHRWGYVAVKLDVPLPNIVLDALGNNSVFGTNLPASFRKDQRLSLEGDFDRYFTLYCPEGYEQDALYLFTADIMTRFTDSAAELDVEIVDDWLFLYTRRPASTLDAATWAWLFGAVGALITKLDQWARWRDDRLAQAPITAPGPAAVATGGHPVAGTHALPFAPPAGMLTPPPGVAREGRRLKRGVRWVTIVFAVVVLAGWVLARSLF